MRRSSPNWVATALAGLWLILFLAAPLFRISPFGLSVPFISQGVGGASAIGAAPAVLLMLIPGILMLLSSLLWEKNVGLILSGATFVILLIFLRMMYTGPSRRAGSVVIQGGMFMGVTLVFVPVMQFLLFGYVDRLNISVSAFRTILTGYLNTVLYGCFLVLLAMEILTFLFLLIAIARAAHGKKKKSR